MDLETRKREKEHVTFPDLVEGFRRVGVHSGDIVYVHSSLSKFGYVEGGVDTVVDALIEAVGPEGTVAATSATYSKKKDGSVFDVRNSPSELGVISETLRRRTRYRSHHLTESVSALGRLAEELTAAHSLTPAGAESPFQKFIKYDAQIMLLGVDHNSNTTIEAIEEEMAGDYVGFGEIRDATIVDEEGKERPLPAKVHNMAVPYDFNRIDRPLRRAGGQAEIVIGESIVRRVSAKKLRHVVRESIEANMYAMRVRGNEQRIQIPTSKHEL